MANKGGVQPSQTAVPDTTPKLQDSSLQQGDVQMLQEGQQVMKRMQKPATPAPQNSVAAPAVPPASNMVVPDPISFAKEKIGGNLAGAGQAPIRPQESSRWLPLLQRLATSPTSSGLLQQAYINRLSQEMGAPRGNQVAILRQRDFDERIDALGNK